MKTGNLVKHKEIPSLGSGLVTELKGVHCMVLWPLMSGKTPLSNIPISPGPCLEANCMLEVISESR